MNNIEVTKIEFLGYLLPHVECSFAPFCSTPDVRTEDLPGEINHRIWEELRKDLDVIPVKMTIKVIFTGRDITDDIADEVMAVARRTLKSVEYVNGADRGAIYSGLLGNKPYVFAMKVSPLSVIEALTSGSPYNVKIIGFLTREK